jgi:hypothetical protein
LTSALIFASCDQVSTTPPGTFHDRFESELEFTGTVNGISASADITWKGVTKEGGDIEAVMFLSNGLEGTLKVDATVATGGSYAGFVRFDD